jgi:hypothetical protein
MRRYPQAFRGHHFAGRPTSTPITTYASDKQITDALPRRTLAMIPAIGAAKDHPPNPGRRRGSAGRWRFRSTGAAWRPGYEAIQQPHAAAPTGHRAIRSGGDGAKCERSGRFDHNHRGSQRIPGLYAQKPDLVPLEATRLRQLVEMGEPPG